MKKFFNDIIVALKGFGMGAANVVPGVSGGTVALLTGIFGRIVACLNSVTEMETWRLILSGRWREFWREIDGRFLIALLLGVMLSIFTLARLMEYVLNHYPIQTWAFFFGMIAASAVVMLVNLKNWKGMDALWLAAGLVLGVVVCTLSPTTTPDDLVFVFVCGAIAICTMILPGVSGSFVLLILGKYEYIMAAVNEMNLPVLAVFAFGCIVGILAFSKFLHRMLECFERQTMLVLVGFVIGSLVRVWPWSDQEAIVRSQFMQNGMDKDTAALALDTILESGQRLEFVITDPHTEGAIFFALTGVFLVGLLDYLSRQREAQN